MAPTNPAAYLQNRSDHPAQLFRMVTAGIIPGAMPALATSPVGGVNPYFGNRLNVTGNAAMTVNVDTGLVYMPGAAAWQGMYAGYNTASYVVTVPASSSTQWRSDYIVARQHDTAFGDADNNWDIVDVAGSFSSSAPGTLPTLSGNVVPLAIIRVVPNMTVTNGGGTVVDARVWGNLAGPLFTNSTALPPSTMPNGTMWVERDTNRLGVLLNSTYCYLYNSATLDIQEIIKTADETVTSSTTLQNDNQLLLPYQPNATYIFRCWVDYEGANVGTGDLKWNWSGLTSGTNLRYTANYMSLTGTFSPTIGAAVNLGSSTLAAGTNGSGNPVGFEMVGSLSTGSTGGTLQLQWAQNTSNATGTIVHAQSFLRLERTS